MRLCLRSNVLVAVVLGVFWAAGAQAQTADEVIGKHIAAIGGRAALEKLETRVSTGTISMSVQGTAISGPAEITAKAPNKSRSYFSLDLSQFGAGEIVVDQRCDGKTAWASNSMQGERELTGSQLQAILNSTFPTPLLGYKESGATAELVGKETVGTRPAIAVKLTPKAGNPTTFYFDAENYLLLRTASRIEVPEAGGEVEQKSELEDYREVDGVKLPFVVKISNGMQDISVTLNKIEHNKPVDEAIFSKPAGK